MEAIEIMGQLLPFLIPLIILQLALLVVALVDLVKRQNVTGGSKIVWLLLIVFVQVIGPAVYLIVGRREPPVERN